MVRLELLWASDIISGQFLIKTRFNMVMWFCAELPRNPCPRQNRHS
jgi:hypothetical protein